MPKSFSSVKWQNVFLTLVLAIGVSVFFVRNFILPRFPANPCVEENYDIGAWELCIAGIQTRSVKIKDGIICSDKGVVATTRECSTQNKVLILKDYTTQINPDLPENFYEQNYRNIKIVPKGEFKSLKLHLAATTTVLGGKPIQVPEYYYFMFALGENTARVIETTRIDSTRLDLTGVGIFKGTDTPIEKTFDLSNIVLAATSDEYVSGGIGQGGIGSTSIGGGSDGYLVRDFVDTVNENADNELIVTLFLADGRSMVEPDLAKRIFGTISFAYLEYECVEGKICSIERIPSIAQ